MAAKSPVKKMVAPIPTYLLTSVGVLFNIDRLTPEQKRKKSLMEFICGWIIKLEECMEDSGRMSSVDYYSTRIRIM